MAKRQSWLVLIMATLLIVGGAVTWPGSSTAAERYIVIATGGVSGTYYPIGGGMAELMNKHMKNIKATAEVTGASLENCRLVQKDEAQFAQANASAAYLAYYGMPPFKTKLAKLRAVMSMHPSHIQFVVLKSSGINSFADLKGKKVNVGPPGGSTFVSSWDLLELYGFKKNDINAVYLSFSEAVKAMKDGNLDCAVVSSSVPNPAVTELAVTRDIKLLEVDQDILKKLVAKFPYYTKTKIPAEAYKGVDKDIWAMTVMNVVVCNADLETDLVYNALKLWFENKAYLVKIHPIVRYMTMELAPQVPIPLHPGAEKYFREIGAIK